MPEDGKDTFWVQSSRLVLAAVMTAFARLCPGKWTLRDVLLVLRSAERIEELLKQGADRDLVFQTIWQRFKAWRGGNSRVMNVVFDRAWFRRQGLFSLAEAAPVVIA